MIYNRPTDRPQYAWKSVMGVVAASHAWDSPLSSARVPPNVRRPPVRRLKLEANLNLNPSVIEASSLRKHSIPSPPVPLFQKLVNALHNRQICLQQVYSPNFNMFFRSLPFPDMLFCLLNKPVRKCFQLVDRMETGKPISYSEGTATRVEEKSGKGRRGSEREKGATARRLERRFAPFPFLLSP